VCAKRSRGKRATTTKITMNNNSGPGACRRSARSKNVFEYNESFCSGPYDSRNVMSFAGQGRYAVDPDSKSHNSPEKVQRKKRRKSTCDSSLEKRSKIIKRRTTELSKLRRSYEELIRVKLKDSRIPVVLLQRLDDHRHSQPKLADFRKEEKRIQLPGLTIPAQVDPKILKCNVVVKINKRQTEESLIEISKRRLLRLSSASDIDERREGDSAGSVLKNDIKKCTERLTDKLESYSSDDNKCSKNQPVSNSGRRHARTSVDKSNNNRLPERLREAGSRFSLGSITESSIDEIHPDSSKYSRSFVHNNRRLKRTSLDQISENSFTSLHDDRPKCTDSSVDEVHEKHCEAFGKGIRRYSRNSSKDVQKHLQNVSNNSDQKCFHISVDDDEILPLFSSNDTIENQTDITYESNKRIPKDFIEHNKRRTRNSINKSSERYSDDSVYICSLKTSLEHHNNKRLSEKSHKDIDNDSNTQIENPKIFTRQMANKNVSLVQNTGETGINNSEKSIEDDGKKLEKKQSDKIDQCLGNETENYKKITRNHDDRNERHSDNLIEVRMNFIENFVEQDSKILEKEDKNVEICIKKQTETTKRSTRSKSDTDKNIHNAQENHLDHIDNCNESSQIKSENVNKSIQRCSKNLNESIKRLSKNSEKAVHLIEDNSENHSKNFEDEGKIGSKNSTPNCEEKSDPSKNVDKVENISNQNIQSCINVKDEHFPENSNEDYFKSLNNKFTKILKIPIENKILRKSIGYSNNKKLTGTSKSNNFNTIHSCVEEPEEKHLNIDVKNKTTNSIIEKNQRSRRKLVGKSNDNNTPVNTEDSIEKHYERLTENLNKNINERSKTPIEIISKRATRISDKRMEDKEDSKLQTDNIKEIRRKISMDKSETSKYHNCIEKNKNEFFDESPANMKDCSQIEHDYKMKMVTRNSYYKQNKNVENACPEKDSVKEKNEQFIEESDKSIKEFPKLSTDKLTDKTMAINVLLDKNDAHFEDSLNSEQISVSHPIDDNEKEVLTNEIDNIKNSSEIQNECKVITRLSSVNENKSHVEDLKENHSNSFNNSIKKNIKELPEDLNDDMKRPTIITTENKKIVRRKSLFEKTEPNENVINGNSESIQDSENNELKESHKNIKENSKQTDNSMQSENNSEECDDPINKKKHSEESPKHIKDCSKIQSEHKMVTRKSSSCKYENQTNIVIKSMINHVQSDINKCEEKLSEELHENIIENMEIVKNVSSNNLIKDKAVYVQNGIHKDEKNFSNDLYKSIKDYSKSQIEDSKKLLRKLSSDKCAENFVEKNSDSRNTADKNEEKFVEELQKVIKDCSKSQIENNKRVTRKSSSDKHERHVENLVSSDSNVNQNYLQQNKELYIIGEALSTNCIDSSHSVDKDNEIEFERLDNKENSNVPLEINAKIIKNVSHKKEIVSNNLVQDAVDYTQALIEENRDEISENFVGNMKVFSKNASDDVTIQKNSDDTIIDIRVQNDLSNSSLFLQHSVDEISERQPECSDQSCKNRPKECMEDNRITSNFENNVTKQSENVIESMFEKAQAILKPSDEKYETDAADSEDKGDRFINLDNNKQTSDKSSDTFSENFINNDVQYVANVVSVSESTDKNHKTYPATVTESEKHESTSQDAITSVLTNHLIDSNRSCLPISTNANDKNLPSANTEMCSENLMKNVIENAEDPVTKKCENHLEFVTKNDQESLAVTEIAADNLQVTEDKCFENIDPQVVSFTNNENQFEDYFENFSECVESITIDVKNNDGKIIIEARKNLPAKSDEAANQAAEGQKVDNRNDMITEKLSAYDTKGEKKLLQGTSEISTEILDGSIKNSSVILREDNETTTCHSLNKKDGLSLRNLNIKSHVNNSQIPRDVVNNKISSIKSIEVCLESSVDDNKANGKTMATLSKNTPTSSDLQFDGKTTERGTDITESNKSVKRMTGSTLCRPESTFNGLKGMNDGLITDSIINHEARFMLSYPDKQEHTISNEEMFIVERRKVTLMELKKKCTGNLDKRQLESLELSKLKADTSRLAKFRSSVLNSSVDSTMDNASENEDNSRENMSEDVDSDENLTDELKRLIRLRIESKYSNKDHQQTEKIVANCPRTPSHDTNARIGCKDCGKDFFSNRELKRHMKIEHRQRLVIKITKTNANKHVTHIVEPMPTSRAEESNNDSSSEKTAAVGNNEALAMAEEAQEKEKGDIKIIVKKEGGSRNSHVVKEIKITPKPGENGAGVGGCLPPDCRAVPAKPGVVVKRPRGRPRKYPLLTGDNKVAEKQPETTKAPSDTKRTVAPAPKAAVVEPIFDPVESIALQPDAAFNNHESIPIAGTLSAKAKWMDSSPHSSLAKLCSFRRKRRRTLSPQSQTEAVFVPARKRGRPAKYRYLRDDDETASEPDFCTKYRITKELVVRLTKLDSVPKVSKGFRGNAGKVGGRIGDYIVDDDLDVLAESGRRRLASSRLVFEAGHREPLKSVARTSLESNNNNINDIEKCLSVAGISRRMLVHKEAQGTSGNGPAVGSPDDGPADVPKHTRQRTDASVVQTTTSKAHDVDTGNAGAREHDNNDELISEAQLVVTPKRQTIDRTDADESQKAKLLMLMNATTPYESAGNKATCASETPQILQPLPTTMQLQPQQFCILFIPDAIYTSESANKEFTPTATIVNFQPVPDAEMANRSLIYTPTTPTKISIDEHARSYVCATCTQVLDMIGRLEASLGMTEEDKSTIKCPYCPNHFQSLFYLEYHVMQEHLKCENEKQCRHSRFNSLRIPNHEAASEFEIYITFALKCRSCYDIFNTVLQLNDHVMQKHKTLVRLRPSMGAAAVEAVCTAYPAFARKNGVRNPGPVLQCPSDCVCRIGIRSTDTPLQRQQMLKRCPHVMRRLEKIESAAYEVYTCTFCKSTFLMKDEVVDHLMKMHEVSCKFPCYTCLTSFRSLQMQENHRCSETTLQDIDKILSIAILPTNVGGKDSNKYLEREDASTDEYRAAMKAGGPNVGGHLAPPPPLRNGFKRKNEGTNAAQASCLAKKPKPGNGFVRKRRRHCPKCKKRFAYWKSLQDHIIYEHILKGDGHEGPKKTAIEVLKLVKEGKGNGQRAKELAKLLVGHTDPDGVPLKDLTMMDEQENWEELTEAPGKDSINKDKPIECGRCKMPFRIPANSGANIILF
jgi:hypothetical protein